MFGSKPFDIEVNGLKYQYLPDEDCDGDCVKLWHTIVLPTGKSVTMDWSPYSTPTVEDITLWIKLGMPARITGCPLNKKDLETLEFAQALKENPDLNGLLDSSHEMKKCPSCKAIFVGWKHHDSFCGSCP